MGLLRSTIFLFCMATVITAPPVTQKKPDGAEGVGPDSEVKGDLDEYMEYHRYLKEVVAALESDPEFRQKLENADAVDIRSGRIAHELDFVNHSVRTKLDEIKRNELERLRHLMEKQYELTNNIDTAHAKISSQAEHIDHNNPHTFEIDDLKKLIQKTTELLEEADKKRRDEFKEYEMQKEFEKQQKLQSLDEEHRKEFEKEIHDKEDKHKKHEPLHHPGSRQQLEEVWEKQDHMDSQQFNPKVFFMLHDVDGNGVWDQTEVKALFLKELDKMYENGAPEDDMRERQEEMERMREHVFRESDTNKDGFISYEEFLLQTRRAEFEKDPGWKTLDEEEVYSPQEYQEFERHRLEEVQKLVEKGMLPPHVNYNYNPGMPPHQQYPNNNQMPHPAYQQQQYHPNAIPQPQYHPNQQYHPNVAQQVHQQQQQQQYHPNAVPQMQAQPQQYHPNGVQQQQQHVNPNAVPQGQQQHNPNLAAHQQYQQPQQQQQQQYQPNVAGQHQQQYQPNVAAQQQQPQQPQPNVAPQQQMQPPQPQQHQPNVGNPQQPIQNPPPVNNIAGNEQAKSAAPEPATKLSQ